MTAHVEVSPNFATEAGDAEFLAYCISTGAMDTPRVHVSRIFCLECNEECEYGGFTGPAGVVRAMAELLAHSEDCLGRMSFETEPAEEYERRLQASGHESERGEQQ